MERSKIYTWQYSFYYFICTVKVRGRVGYSQPYERPMADQEEELGLSSPVQVAQ